MSENLVADYKPLLRRAIAALPKNDGAARRAVYEEARSSLVRQLRAITPTLPARDITQHRLQLEDCIRQVEQEASEAVIQLGRQPPQPKVEDTIEELARLIGQEAHEMEDIALLEEASKTRTRAKPAARPIDDKSDTHKPHTRGKIVAEGQDYVIRPTVFLPPKAPQEPDFVSVMMPFGADFTSVYRSISSVVKNVGWKVGRADSIWEDQVIIQDIFGLIFRSRVVICDFSTKNPNVLYEAGIAHTLGRDVVPIVQQLSDLPFDLRHHRVLVYENTRGGRAKLKKELEKRLLYLQAN